MVDTGGWLTTRKFIVPADGLRVSVQHHDDLEVSLTKGQIESFPPYHESDLDSELKWADYEGRYRSKWVADPVMHRAETDRNITPTSQQTSGNAVSELAAAEAHGFAPGFKVPIPRRENRADLEAASSRTERVVPAGTTRW